ncbi:MAG: HAD family hydrolase [Promethearchaeota archaeon]
MLKKIINDLRGIVFDFDFTLADSSKGVIECINYAVKKLGFTEFSNEKIKKTIGLTLENTFTYLVGKQHLDKAEKFKHYFIEKADEIMSDFTELFIETLSVIKLLHSKGIKLGIVSTKFRYRIMDILEREELLDFFDVIIGGEDVREHKPDPKGLLEAIKKLNLSISQIIYVGDSLTDAETAFRASIPFIAVLSGVTTQNDFKNYKDIQFIKDVSEIPKLLHLK